MPYLLTKEELLEIFPVGKPRDAQFYWETLGKPDNKAKVLALLREELPAPVEPGERSPTGARRSALLALRAVFASDANSLRDVENQGLENLVAQFAHVTTELSYLIGKIKRPAAAGSGSSSRQ